MNAQDVDVAYVSGPSWDDQMLERLRWLRENDPVRWSEKDDLWLISRFDDVTYISKHQEIFTSSEGVRPQNPIKIGLIDEAEPRHAQLRALINRGFTPRMVRKLETKFREMVTRCIDKIARDGECDFVESISVPLPLWLIAYMIGIREEDWGRFHRWSDHMILADGNEDDPAIIARAGAAFVEYATYATEIIEDRRRNPRDDLVSILANAKDEGVLGEVQDVREGHYQNASEQEVELAKDELIKLMVILMVAGNETTRNGISGGMQLLIENPDERQKLIDDPSRIPMAVEEMVRVVSPVRSFSRTVLENTELRDKKLEQGQRVLLLYPSANRDEDAFPDADRFRVDRNPHHVGFGVGSHFCLGANLARMEMRVVFEEVLRRLPDMEFSEGGPEFAPSALVRSCSRMRVRYTPEA
jgi:cytochrome P450 family 142 subfamily A polypeptide 1